LKLELIKQRATLAEPLVPELPDRELELRDQQRPVFVPRSPPPWLAVQPHSVPGAAR
jgi:hypothetical protein